MAQVYGGEAATTVAGILEEASFSSVSPAKWTLAMSVSSDVHSGYRVEIEYPFRTSYSAVSACRNVSDAWAPAVQSLIRAIITHPDFGRLIASGGG